MILELQQISIASWISNQSLSILELQPVLKITTYPFGLSKLQPIFSVSWATTNFEITSYSFGSMKLQPIFSESPQNITSCSAWALKNRVTQCTDFGERIAQLNPRHLEDVTVWVLLKCWHPFSMLASYWNVCSLLKCRCPIQRHMSKITSAVQVDRLLTVWQFLAPRFFGP